MNTDCLSFLLGYLSHENMLIEVAVKEKIGEELFNKLKQRKVHVCSYCQKSFVKPCALGGHISKKHSKKEYQDIRGQ